MVNFNVTKADSAAIRKIAERAEHLGRDLGCPLDRLSVAMDITATHANGCPLRLDDLLAAPDFDFLHDVLEIGRHLDRRTGKLPEWFCPRFHARSPVAA